MNWDMGMGQFKPGSALMACLFAVSLLLPSEAVATKKIRIDVAGYQFAPYVDKMDDGRVRGLTLDILEALNRIQNRYEFNFVYTRGAGRHQAFKRNRFDMMMFENLNWGWETLSIDSVPLPIRDGETYIALAEEAGSQAYFDNITDKELILVRGYHYKFADWQTEPRTLQKRFKVRFVDSNQASIEAILKHRGEIAPVTVSYLNHYLNLHPQQASLLRVSTQWDQAYSHGILLKQTAPLSKSTLASLIGQLIDSGTLASLAQEYGLGVNTVSSPE